MKPSIQKLAQLMLARQELGEPPYVLLLGSSLSLTPAVRRAFARTEDWEAFWKEMQSASPTERKALLKKPLDALGLERGYQAMARLAGAGYFNLILTLNVDDAIDDAVRPLPADQSVLLIYDGSNTVQIVETLSRATPRLKVVKLRGDINAQALPLTATGQFEFPDDLERAVSEWLKLDTILVGDVPYDTDVQRCIKRSTSALWCILPDEPASDSFIMRARQSRPSGEIITGADAKFNAFFIALAERFVQESTPFEPYPAHEKPSPGTEIATPEEGPKRVHPEIVVEEKEAVRNPFIYGNPISEPRYFYGRHQELRRVADRLTNPGFESSSIIGGRRIGKTSLLQVLKHPQIRERFGLSGEFAFISIDLSRRSNMTQDKFCRLVLEKMQFAFADDKLRSQLAEILGQKEKIDLYHVEPVFEAIVSHGFKPVLLLDEFENALKSPKLDVDFYLGLRSLITAHKLAVVTASRRELAYYSLTEEIAASPFFNVFINIYLISLSTQEARELIKGYLEGTGISFTEDDIEYVMRISGCHPYFLQLACSYLFDTYREKKGISKVGRKKARQAVEKDFRVQAEPHFAYYWQHSSEDEQSVLTTLAQRNQAQDLRTLSGGPPLTSLVNRGIVVESDGDHQIFSPLFVRWILSQQPSATGEIFPPSVKKERIIRPTVFVSYSHEDEKEKEALLTHLGVLGSTGLIDVWSDDRIGAGADWETDIRQAITKAKVAILLISANFLTSKFILKKEVPELLKRRDKEGLTVFPVIAKACAWKKVDWLARMNVRPKNGNPVWGDGGSHVDEDLAAIAEEVADIVRRTG